MNNNFSNIDDAIKCSNSCKINNSQQNCKHEFLNYKFYKDINNDNEVIINIAQICMECKKEIKKLDNIFLNLLPSDIKIKIGNLIFNDFKDNEKYIINASDDFLDEIND